MFIISNRKITLKIYYYLYPDINFLHLINLINKNDILSVSLSIKVCLKINKKMIIEISKFFLLYCKLLFMKKLNQI